MEVVEESVKRDLSGLSHKQLAAIFKQTSPEFDGIVLDFKVPYVESRIIQALLGIRDVYPESEFPFRIQDKKDLGSRIQIHKKSL